MWKGRRDEGPDDAARLLARSSPDCKQVVIALIVNVEGFPLSYETFDGNRADVTTLETVMRMVERKYGQARRVWVFDRGIVSEENLAALRRRGGQYLVGTPRSKLKQFERALLDGKLGAGAAGCGSETGGHAGREETYVLCRTAAPPGKEKAIREPVFDAAGDRRCRRLAKRVAAGRLKDRHKIERRWDASRPASAGGRLIPDGACARGNVAALEWRICWRAPRLAGGARGRLSAAHQSAGQTGAGAVDEVHPADRGGGRLSRAEKRAVDPSAVPSTGAPRQGPYPGGLPRLRAVGDA